MSQRITIGTTSLSWNDAYHCMNVNGYELTLSPTQYRICRAFLAESETKNGLVSGKFVILSYRSFDELLKEMNLPRSALIKHISNLNARMMTTGLALCSFQRGYVLALSSNAAQLV
jgi:hypothetical protein